MQQLPISVVCSEHYLVHCECGSVSFLCLYFIPITDVTTATPSTLLNHDEK